MNRGKWQVIITLTILLAGSADAQLPGYPDPVFTEYFRLNSGGWTAGDATISVPLPDGRTVWLFGDSYLENVNTANNTLSCLFQIRNCMLVQDSVDLNQLTTHIDETQTGVLRSTFKLGPSDPAILWPGHGFTDADTAYIYLDEIDGSTLDNLGTYIARLQLPSLSINSINALPHYGAIQSGRAVLTDTATGYRYIYGNRLNWIVWEPVVARTLIGTNIEAPYQFYTGSGWSFNHNLAATISSDPVSPGFSVILMNGKYSLITQENGYLTCGLGREIYVYESDKPWGPFINKTLVYTIEDTFNGNYLLTYNAQAHPSFTENNELLISYNLNDWVDTTLPYICPSQCIDLAHNRMDADTYRPKFIRVPFNIGVSANLMAGATKSILFPNPVEGNTTVRVREMHQPCMIRINDLWGRETGLVNVDSTNPVISAPEKPGVYIVHGFCDGRVMFAAKLIVL
jgi:hypothetical protein